MAEAEAVCDRVALIDRGRVLAVESPASLSRAVSLYERIDFEWHGDGLIEDLAGLPGVASVSALVAPRTFRLELSTETAALPVLHHLVTAGVTSIRTSRPTLEEVYLRLVRDASSV